MEYIILGTKLVEISDLNKFAVIKLSLVVFLHYLYRLDEKMPFCTISQIHIYVITIYIDIKGVMNIML